MTTIRISHYSDILCIWAYIGQIRVDELLRHFTDQVTVNYCLFPVFGATHEKIKTVWGDRGGAKAYNKHVLDISELFDHIPVHQDIWVKNIPHSSLPAHHFLFATLLLEQEEKVAQGSFVLLTKAIRQAFFVDLKDVSNTEVLASLIEETNLPLHGVLQKINTGQAFAAMSIDMQKAQKLAINSSPTMLFNENRQRLAGNVGYRIIEANIRELIDKPNVQQTWC